MGLWRVGCGLATEHAPGEDGLVTGAFLLQLNTEDMNTDSIKTKIQYKRIQYVISVGKN